MMSQDFSRSERFEQVTWYRTQTAGGLVSDNGNFDPTLLLSVEIMGVTSGA
jgi:hypothetical protein